MKRRAYRIQVFGLALALAVLASWGSLQMPVAYQVMQNILFDAYQRHFPRQTPQDLPIAVIDIDEAALAEFGQWPWPRVYMAEMTERLYAAGALAVGFDILFAEADRTSPENVAAAARRFGFAGGQAGPMDEALRHDGQFARALGLGPSVLALAGAPMPMAEGRAVLPKAGVAITGALPPSLPAFEGALLPLPELLDAAVGLGVVSLTGGTDTVLRKVPMISVTAGQPMPALSAEMLRVAQGAGGYLLQTSQASGQLSAGISNARALRVGALDIPLEADGAFRLHFTENRPDRMIQAGAVLAQGGMDPATAARIAGRLVLIGSSAQGLFDIRVTARGETVAGVLIHADILEQVLTDHFLSRPDWLRGAEIVAIWVLLGLVALLLARDRAVLGLSFALALSIGSVVLGLWLFAAHRILFDPLPVITAMAMLAVPGGAIALWRRDAAKRAIRAQFAQFVPEDVLPILEADPDRLLTPAGAERVLSVLFVDIEGFSAKAEGMAPTQVVAFVNRFFEEISAELLAQGATIDKYMGDAVMAFWNAPIARPDHASRALAALAPVHRAGARALEGLAGVSVRMGLNTGPAAIGFLGSQARLSYSCLGESVNLAARLEGLTRAYGVWNCVGADCIAALPEGLAAIELDHVVVKGFSLPAPIYTVLADRPELADFSARLRAARAAYRAQDWDQAEALFAALPAQPCPDGIETTRLCALYLARIAAFRRTPPPQDWDGSFAFDRK